MEPSARAGVGAVRVEELALLGGMLPVSLGNTLSALLLGSLNPGELIDLGDADLSAE